MKQYTVTTEFTVHAHNAADAERKVHAMIFARDPAPPFDLPAYSAQALDAGPEQIELPWSPTGPGCTALR